MLVCNPPFFKNLQDARQKNQRKVKNLKLREKDNKNFGGQANELWYKGSEEAFIKKMVTESIQFKNQVRWFTSLISYFLNIEYSYFNVDKIQGLQGKISTGDIGEWLNSNIGYTNLIIGVFIALWVRIFDRHYNIYEIIVMLCFVLGEATLILSFAFIIGELTNNGFIVLGIMLIFFLYPIWAIGQFFGKKNLVNYFKSLIVVILGYSSYLFVFILIGYFWNIIQN